MLTSVGRNMCVHSPLLKHTQFLTTSLCQKISCSLDAGIRAVVEYHAVLNWSSSVFGCCQQPRDNTVGKLGKRNTYRLCQHHLKRKARLKTGLSLSHVFGLACLEDRLDGGKIFSQLFLDFMCFMWCVAYTVRIMNFIIFLHQREHTKFLLVHEQVVHYLISCLTWNVSSTD